MAIPWTLGYSRHGLQCLWKGYIHPQHKEGCLGVRVSRTAECILGGVPPPTAWPGDLSAHFTGKGHDEQSLSSENPPRAGRGLNGGQRDSLAGLWGWWALGNRSEVGPEANGARWSAGRLTCRPPTPTSSAHHHDLDFNLGVGRRCDRQGPAGPVEAPDDGARRAESRATYCPTVNAIGLGVVEG